MLDKLFKSVIDQDNAQVVICDPDHTIVYMNPAAVRNYADKGGADLLGRSIFSCHNEKSVEIIKKVINWFQESPDHNKVHTFFNTKHNRDVYMVALRDEEGNFIGYYEKHEYRTRDESPLYDLK